MKMKTAGAARVGIVTVATGTLAFALSHFALEGASSATPALPAAAEQAAWPFDDVPGLGRSATASQRDEAIAVFESWRRASQTATCMASKGQFWAVELDYPLDDEVLSSVRSVLGLSPGATMAGQQSASEANSAHVAGLSASALSSYTQALYGESAAAMAAAGEDGVPEGRGADFARGGCKGAAWNAVGSVWDLKEALTAELDDMRQQAQATSAYKNALPAYQACAQGLGIDSTKPQDVEGQDLSADTATQFAVQCEPLWHDAVAAGVTSVATGFKAQHALQLTTQIARYATTVATAAANVDFVKWLNGDQ